MNAEGHPAESMSATGPAPNLVERVSMVFFSPGKLGEHLRQASPWLLTLTIVAVVSTIAWLLIPTDILRHAMEAQAARRPPGQGSPDPETMLKIFRFGGAASALAFTYVAAVVVAGALYLVFNLGLGQEHSYRQHLSATAHIYWINMLGFLLTIPIWVAKEDIQIRLGLGLLLPDAPESFVGHFLNSINLFGLWGAAALGGIESALSGARISAGKATGTVLGLYLVWALLSAVRGSVFGA